MEQSPIRGIPYPSEYEDPFFASFEDMVDFVDEYAEYKPLPGGILSVGPHEFEYMPGVQDEALLGVGYPVRFKENDGDPWLYAIVRMHNPASGQVFISGAEFPAPLTEIEVGSPSMVQIIRMHYPGNFNAGGNAIFWNDIGQGFAWPGPKASLVKMAAVNKVSNSGGLDYVNAQRNSALNGGGTYSAPVWLPVMADNSGDGVTLVNTQWVMSEHAITENYTFYSGDIIDIWCKGTSPNDAEDLSVELTFVLHGYHALLCIGNAPQIEMTISGMSGSDWQGLTDGVHNICPVTSYFRFWYMSSYTTTNWYKIEEWIGRGQTPHFTGDILTLWASYMPTIPYANSTIIFAFDSVYTSVSYTTGISGYIQDRLFQTFVVSGVTFTLNRGPGEWGNM